MIFCFLINVTNVQNLVYVTHDYDLDTRSVLHLTDGGYILKTYVVLFVWEA